MIYFDTTFHGERSEGDVIQCKVMSPADKARVISGEEVRVSTPVSKRSFLCRPVHQLPGSIWKLEILKVEAGR